LEQSNPAQEREGIRLVTVFSPALGHRADITLALPPGHASFHDLPILLLLHGVYGSHWAWAWNGGAHRTLRTMVESGELRPMVLAMPSDGLLGHGSGYIPQSNADYETWIVHDVPRAVRQAAVCTSDASPLFIAGLSMGGFGALRLGAKYPDRFRGISGHSSITEFGQLRELFIPDMPDPEGWIGHPEATVLHWMKTHRKQVPPIRFDCGRDDVLLSANRRLHAELTNAKVNHAYEEFAGGHGWDYWSNHLADTLRFAHTVLSMQPKPLTG
jgi:enterochelin esterase-like enzyme